MMAYALVTGSTYAMVGAISSMDSAAKGAASSAASQAASGNVNLGNDSMSNYNANKLNSVNDVSTGMKRNYYDTRLKDTSDKTVSGKSSADDNTHKNLSGSSSVIDNSHKNLAGSSSVVDNSHVADMTGQPNQSIGGMDVGGLSGRITQTGGQVSSGPNGLTGSKASLENFIKKNDPKALGKADRFLNKNPNSILSLTSRVY